MTEENKVQWVYGAGSTEELARRYDEWAKDYDSDLARDYDYTGHIRGVEEFAKYVDQGAHVIDIWCGPGPVAHWPGSQNPTSANLSHQHRILCAGGEKCYTGGSNEATVSVSERDSARCSHVGSCCRGVYG